MGKIDSWITKLTRLKNSKVARFSYKAEAYANDDIEGVENYDYSRDMNIPLATHTDFDPDVLSIGARTQFSSVTKNGLNHFFGRVSYNLNKVIDFLDDFLTDFISLDDRFTSFTEIVTFSSSATLSNYKDGTTKRLLNTSGSTITITLPAGETYLGGNKITLSPSIMLTIAKRGTVWVNSSGNAITADKWKTARNITITDADGTNTGTAVSVDGSENKTLKLPSTIKAALSGNASTATAPFYQWKKVDRDLFRYVDGEITTYYWYKLCKITTAMTFDIEVVSDNNHPYRASYRLSVTSYSEPPSYSVSLFNLGQAVKGEANLAVALDADGYVYIQTNAMWTSALFVTLLYSKSSDFSITMDKLGYASFGTSSGFTPVNLLTQTGAFKWVTSGSLQTYTPTINTDIVGNLTGNADTADKWKTSRNITISDADGTNTGTAVSVDGSENETLKLPATIKANITGNADTADKWKTARNITISDADGTNTGTAVSVDGSENETLKLPPTIKANLTGNLTGNVTGNADTATKLKTARKINGVDFDGTSDVYDTYSTAEHRIGTWIDGKPLYRKVINFGALPNNTSKDVAHGITNLKQTTKLYGVATDGTVALPLPFGSPDGLHQSIRLRLFDTNIGLRTGENRTAYTAIVCIEYTKTTD